MLAKTVESYKTATQEGAELLSVIAADDRWSWARGNKSDKLQQVKEGCKDKRGPICVDLTLNDVNFVMCKYEHSILIDKAAKERNVLDEAVTTLKQKMSSMKRMQQQNLSP